MLGMNYERKPGASNWTGLFASIGNTLHKTCQRHTPLSTPLCALCAHALCLCSAPLAAAIHSLGHPKHNRSLSAGGTRAPHVYSPAPLLLSCRLSSHTHSRRARPLSLAASTPLYCCCCCLVPLECVSSSLSTSSCQSASLSLSRVPPLSRSLSTTHTHKHKRAKPHAHKKTRTKRRHKSLLSHGSPPPNRSPVIVE